MTINKNKPGDSNIVRLPVYDKAQPIHGIISERPATAQNKKLNAALRRGRDAAAVGRNP